MTNDEEIHVEANSTFLDPAVKSKQDLIDWALLQLGYPLVTVELTDSQIDSCIQNALEVYTKYAYLGPDKYLVADLNSYEHNVGLNLSAYNIVSVKDIATPRDAAFATGGDLFWGPYAWLGQGNGIYPMSTNRGTVPTMGTWVTWQAVSEFFELSKRMTGSNPDWQYDKWTKQLRLMPEPPSQTKDQNWILLTCQVMPSYPELYGNEYVKRLFLAKMKMLLGIVRKKFQNVQLPGGGSIDTTIGDEGKQEWDDLVNNIIQNEAKGQCCYIV